MPEGDAPLGQVVRRDLACHQVAHLYGSGRVGWPRWASVRLSCCRPWHEAVRHANRVTRPLLHRRPGTSGEGPATKGRRRGAGGKGRRVTHREPPHGTLASSKGTGLPACAKSLVNRRAGQNLDEVFADLARNVGQDYLPTGGSEAELPVRVRIRHQSSGGNCTG